MATGKGPNSVSERPLLLLPVFFAALVYLFCTSSRAVIDYDEGYYAQAARHMALSGDWITPYANGVRFLEKPPLLYWITALSFKIFGVSEFALRLPTALAVVALVWIVTRTARRAADAQAALTAGLSMAFAAGTFLFTRETLHDIWLVFFIAAAMCAFLEWYLDPRRPLRPALIFYAALAGACLCKGLIGIVFPIAVIALFFLISRERPRCATLHLLPGAFLFLALTVPWHWLAAARNPGFLRFFFVGEQLLRFVGRREPPVVWSLSLTAFWLLVLVWFFPWSVFLPGAFARIRKPGAPNRRVLLKLALLWAAVVLGFFSVSDRLEHYAFPALPALSLMIGVSLARNGEDKSALWGFRALAALGILALAAAIGGGFWINAGRGFQSGAEGLADRLSDTDFSILADMPPSLMSSLLLPAAVTAVAMAVGFAAALRFEARRRRVAAVLSLAVVMAVVCGMTHWSLIICEDLISSKKFAEAVAQEARPGDRLVVMGDYESANSLNFYQPLRVEVCDGTAYALIPGLKYPDAPKIILSMEEFQTVWQSADRVFVLVPKSRRGEVRPAGVEIMNVLHRVLVRNH